jgi:hypothetical protein
VETDLQVPGFFPEPLRHCSAIVQGGPLGSMMTTSTIDTGHLTEVLVGGLSTPRGRDTPRSGLARMTPPPADSPSRGDTC